MPDAAAVRWPGGEATDRCWLNGDGCSPAVSVPSFDGQMHDEREAADAQTVAVFQNGLLHYSVIDPEAIEAAEVEHLPAARVPGEPAVSATDVRQRQPQVGVAVAAREHFWAVEEDRPPRRLR